MVILMLLFGTGMILVILFGDSRIGLRMVNAFASMFVGVLGLGSGYLLARTGYKKQSNGKEDTHDGT